MTSSGNIIKITIKSTQLMVFYTNKAHLSLDPGGSGGGGGDNHPIHTIIRYPFHISNCNTNIAIFSNTKIHPH
jgi:hypothetical protein